MSTGSARPEPPARACRPTPDGTSGRRPGRRRASGARLSRVGDGAGPTNSRAASPADDAGSGDRQRARDPSCRVGPVRLLRQRQGHQVGSHSHGALLDKLGRIEQGIAAYDDVVDRFGGASDPTLRIEVASALASKGAILGRLGLPAEALAAYEAFEPYQTALSKDRLRRFQQSDRVLYTPLLQRAPCDGRSCAGVGQTTVALLTWPRRRAPDRR